MTESVFSNDTLQHLNEQQWRRLGLSQTFDRLLVQEAGARPAPSGDVQARISANLGGGAAKFLALTFDKLVKDLCRRSVLRVDAGNLGLHHDFAGRLGQLLEAEERGDSRVDPTPGITLADVVRLGEEREKRAKEKPVRAKAAPKPARPAGETPRTRKSAKEKAAAAAAAPAAPAPVAAPQLAEATPNSQLFTSRNVNKLLDSLDTGPLLKDQIRERLALRGTDFERFLHIAGALELTRITRDDQVELHWKGRQLVRTEAAERRIVLIDLVKELRDRAEGE